MISFNGGLSVLAYSLDFGIPALIARKYLPLTFYLTFPLDNWVHHRSEYIRA